MSKAPIIDHHVHLDGLSESARQKWLAEARSQGVVAALIPGCFPEQWPDLLQTCSTRDPENPGRPFVAGALGLHPYWTRETTLTPDALCSAIEAKLSDERVVALGEMGLDKGRGAPVERQSAFFEAQLRLARERELPVVCHQVGLREVFLSSLERAGGCPQGGVVHGFSGDPAWAKALVSRGFLLGVGAGLLNSARQRLRHAVAAVPWSHLLLESDEIENDAALAAVKVLQQTLGELARLKAVSPQEAAEKTTENALRLYRWPSGSPASPSGKQCLAALPA